MQTEGERIKLIRNSIKGMSQQKMADFFGFSRTYLSSIENDKDQLSRKHLSKLLLTYNVNINFVLEGIGSMFIGEFDVKEKITPELQQIVKDEVKSLLSEYGLTDVLK